MNDLERLLDRCELEGTKFSLNVLRMGWGELGRAGPLFFVVTWDAPNGETHEDHVTAAAAAILGGEWIVSRFRASDHGCSGAAWVSPVCRGCGEAITGGLCGARCWGGGVCLLKEGHTIPSCGTNDHVALCGGCLAVVIEAAAELAEDA